MNGKSSNFMLLRKGPSLFNISQVLLLFSDFSQEALVQAQGFSYQWYASSIQYFIIRPDLSINPCIQLLTWLLYLDISMNFKLNSWPSLYLLYLDLFPGHPLSVNDIITNSVTQLINTGSHPKYPLLFNLL